MRHKLEQPDPRRAVLAVARAGIVELRESCGPLQPPAQITHLVRSGGARLADNLPARAPLAVKITLFRALEEALSNATRHGGGVGVRVHVEGQADGLSLTVSDQGPGFAPEAVPAKGHLGLANLRERAELLGGSFHVTLAPGRGTTLVLWMPLGADGEET